MNIQIPYQPFNFKFQDKDGARFIFDVFRKKYIFLSPEEWVRQNLLQALVEVFSYPKGLIAVEKELRINQLKRRYDAVVFDKERQPWMLIECKAPQVKLSEETLSQTLNYYRNLQCPYIMICNGPDCFVAKIDATSFTWLERIPVYDL